MFQIYELLFCWFSSIYQTTYETVLRRLPLIQTMQTVRSTVLSQPQPQHVISCMKEMEQICERFNKIVVWYRVRCKVLDKVVPLCDDVEDKLSVVKGVLKEVNLTLKQKYCANADVKLIRERVQKLKVRHPAVDGLLKFDFKVIM